jgi:adenylate cyclase
MEQNIAILIADLSGYTALTETHGATTAADLIDKYIDIVNNCLVGDTHLHARVGDGVVIISSSADSLIATSIMLFQNTLEDNFLQVHGGLHYGKILKRNNDYFGTTINLAARIAAKADPGSIWCSSEYINALNDKSELTFLPKGKHSFKNISDEIDVHELIIDNPKTFHIDPVCRMLIKEGRNTISHPGDESLFFCSQNCLDVYINKVKE